MRWTPSDDVQNLRDELRELDPLFDRDFDGVERWYVLHAELVARRVTRGMRVRDVADLTGWSKRKVREFEQLESDPTLSDVRRYAASVCCSVAFEVVA